MAIRFAKLLEMLLVPVPNEEKRIPTKARSIADQQKRIRTENPEIEVKHTVNDWLDFIVDTRRKFCTVNHTFLAHSPML